MSDALAQISKLHQQIEALQADAVQQLREKRAALQLEVAAVDAQIAELTGKPVEKQPQPAKELTGRSIPLSELKVLLTEAPDKTISIRKEGLQLENIKTLARVNPHLLSIGGKGAWPTVTLLK